MKIVATFLPFENFLFGNSVTPLWHFMVVTSVVMYSSNYIFHKGKCFCIQQAHSSMNSWRKERSPLNLHIFLLLYMCSLFVIGHNIQASRNEKKIALEEYYEKHGHSGHH